MKFRLIPAIAAFVLLTVSAHAAQTFDETVFAQAQDQGKSVLIDVKAPWCPTCAQQKPIIESIERDHPELLVLDVDFDSAKDVLRRFKVGQQSTLIVFKGKTEVARSTGQTDPDVIKAMIAKGL